MSSGAGTMESEVVMAGIFLLSVVIFSIAVNGGLNAIGRGLKDLANSIDRTSRK